MKLLDLQQNSPAWEEYRRSHIGASDIGILMEGSERDVYNLLQEKRGLAKKFVTAAMQRGTDMEAEAVAWFVKHNGPAKACALHDTHAWLMASFDYLDMAFGDQIEVKCPNNVLDQPSEHSHYKRWWWQIQAQLAVSGLEECVLLVYSPLKQASEVIVRDSAAIEELIRKGAAFYKTMIDFGEVPAPAEILERYDADASEWASAFKAIDDQIKELEEAKKVLRDEGIAIAGEEPFVCNGVKVQKIVSKEAFDYEAACKANKIDVSQFKKTPKSPYTWRVSAS